MERVASRRSGQRVTGTTSKRLFRLQKLSCSRSWHQNTVGCHQERDSLKGTLAWDRGIRFGRPETNPEHIVTEWRDGSENNPKAGTGETFRNFVVAGDTGSALGPRTKRIASCETQEAPDTRTSLTTSPRSPDR